jgi:6-phosphogluconolactonase
LDGSSGALKFAGTTPGVDNPSFLTTDPKQRTLYAANEVAEFGGKPGGAVSAFSIAPGSGALTLLNQQPSHGTSPCHVSVDKTGQFVFVANYGSGSVSVFPIQDNGKLGEATDFVQHEASDVEPERRKAPHAHSIIPDPANRYAFAPDLGLDRIMMYRLDLAQGKLRPNEEPWVQVKAGAGPRHFVFHSSCKYAYVINELDNTVIAFTYDETQGVLRENQTISTLPEAFTGTSYCADVHISPSGRFLYGSNRGHDSIVIFAIAGDTGKLTVVGHERTQGKNPRNFAIDPTGTFLLAANQDTDTIVTFRMDRQTGELVSTRHVTEVPTPVCVKIMHSAS